ncbi:hypothetical protein DFA_11945 [Cavenderia fasciculata]|uniref:Uncharacterized protein n=1 Tax=Cavenderia fasciculata TaxID=261658 RepID=F4QEW9_CACFS|nr:uncharacterized protein DFA_11945 [Cavenderia fasciculata]EGG14176.1 hypothetical protein DFA_11945 [Cavenderia fasciculata]|eukprot:XP_004350884.1 hypothetical protein DFA_11945 [Cavenderia fasciculata]
MTKHHQPPLGPSKHTEYGKLPQSLKHRLSMIYLKNKIDLNEEHTKRLLCKDPNDEYVMLSDHYHHFQESTKSVISFIGDTGVGKSTIIKAFIKDISLWPVTANEGEQGSCLSTSCGVVVHHGTLDDVNQQMERPVLVIDCEGYGGSTETNAQQYQRSLQTDNNNNKSQSTKNYLCLYSQFVYTYSHVIVYMYTGNNLDKSAIKLLTHIKITQNRCTNQHVNKPHIIFVQNKSITPQPKLSESRRKELDNIFQTVESTKIAIVLHTKKYDEDLKSLQTKINNLLGPPPTESTLQPLNYHLKVLPFGVGLYNVYKTTQSKEAEAVDFFSYNHPKDSEIICESCKNHLQRCIDCSLLHCPQHINNKVHLCVANMGINRLLGALNKEQQNCSVIVVDQQSPKPLRNLTQIATTEIPGGDGQVSIRLCPKSSSIIFFSSIAAGAGDGADEAGRSHNTEN